MPRRCAGYPQAPEPAAATGRLDPLDGAVLYEGELQNGTQHGRGLFAHSQQELSCTGEFVEDAMAGVRRKKRTWARFWLTSASVAEVTLLTEATRSAMQLV